MLRDMIRRNASGVWEDGILADSKIQVSDTVSTGLFAIYSAWFSNSPPAGGIKVFYGDANNLVHVHAWDADGNAWTEGFTFPDANGNAGIWATSVGSLAYAYLLNSAGNVQMWWKDFNTTVNSTQHPVGVWNEGPSAGGNIRSNSSVAFDGSQGSGFVQLSNGTFTLIGVTQNSEASTMAASQAQSGFVTGILNSRVAVYTLSSNNTQTTYVLYQIDGGDITQFAHTRPQGS